MPERISLTAQTATSAVRSPFTGHLHTYTWPLKTLQLEMRLPAMRWSDWEQWERLLWRGVSSGDTFIIETRHYPYTAAAIDYFPGAWSQDALGWSSGSTMAALLETYTVRTDTPPGIGELYFTGDGWLNANGANLGNYDLVEVAGRLHRITGGPWLDGGVWKLPVFPGLRDTLTAPAAIRLAQPRFWGRILGQVPETTRHHAGYIDPVTLLFSEA